MTYVPPQTVTPLLRSSERISKTSAHSEVLSVIKPVRQLLLDTGFDTQLPCIGGKGGGAPRCVDFFGTGENVAHKEARR